MLIVDKGFLCLRLTQHEIKTMLNNMAAPATGMTTCNHKLKLVHFGTPQISLGWLERKKMELEKQNFFFFKVVGHVHLDDCFIIIGHDLQ